ncbi:MAG: dihydrofolate reductase [Bacteroidales bacterium]|nr:dihydrofolate reductase [Bacteroidales bacterium]
MKRFSIIVALDENNGIGRNNRLLCHIPGDLKRFRKITTDHTVIMGRNTFLSLPGGPLRNRKNIVITDNKQEKFVGCETVYSIKEAIKKCEGHREHFIIGGASVYRQFLPFTQKLYLTRIHKTFDADTFFPEINPDEWEEISKERIEPDDMHDFPYEYVILKRKKLTLSERISI